MQDGLYKISNDPSWAAAYLSNEETVLFHAERGMANRDTAERGDFWQISDDARLVRCQDPTLIEAANAVLEGRLPRWRQR